jgi:hypothetical protein
MTDPNPFLKTAEAAALLKLTPHQVTKMVSQGILKRGIHFYKRERELGIRFDRANLIKWVKEGGEKQENGIPMARNYIAGKG